MNVCDVSILQSQISAAPDMKIFYACSVAVVDMLEFEGGAAHCAVSALSCAGGLGASSVWLCAVCAVRCALCHCVWCALLLCRSSCCVSAFRAGALVCFVVCCGVLCAVLCDVCCVLCAVCLLCLLVCFVVPYACRECFVLCLGDDVQLQHVRR